MTNKLLRILIIEDNTDHIELLSQVIERHFAPVDIHTVESIDDAFDFIEQTEYNLVFTDCYIGGASIVEQISSLRTKLGGIPIIVITGSGDENLAAEVIKKGANDYVVKTKDSLERIPAIINKYIGKFHPAGESRKERLPIEKQIIDEVSTISRHARHIAGDHSGAVPDSKQLETLLEQIQRLKELASKLRKA